jgi:tRNA-specific 2-thiouridylase
MSGGVDSTYAALLLKEQGHEVIGVTMALLPGQEATAKEAAAVAARLGIEHHVLHLEDAFERHVLTPFADGYAKGLTPSPCVICNRFLKFGAMLDTLREWGCEKLATGHYARLEERDGHFHLHRGGDPAKDQSYFLGQLSQAQLTSAYFPLGESLKKDIQEQVKALGLVPRTTAESQDLCFLPQGDFAPWVLRRHPDLGREGWIVDMDGKRLGRHGGTFRFTQGQRRGLGLGGGPWYVNHVDLAQNQVVVCHEDGLGVRSVSLQGMNWLWPVPPCGQSLDVMAQVRFRMTATAARLTPLESDAARLEFQTPIATAPPGQLAAAYIGDELVASGWIMP